MTLGWTSSVLVIALMAVSGVCGVCQIPDEFKGTYFGLYSNDMSPITFEYRQTTIIWKHLTSNFQTVMRCTESLLEDGFFYNIQTSFGQPLCVQSIKTDLALFYREGSSVDSAEGCRDSFSNVQKGVWVPKFPFSESAVGVDCPMLDGVYTVTYQEASGGTVFCDGDVTSIVTVQGSSFNITSCYSGGVEYTKPLNSQLTCVGVLSGSVMQRPANGDILLLGDFTNDNALFYCVRYLVQGETVQMTLDISMMTEPECQPVQTYATAQADTYTALSLTLATQTTTAPAPDTAAPTTKAETTEPDSTQAPTTVAMTTVAMTTEGIILNQLITDCQYPTRYMTKWWMAYYGDLNLIFHNTFTDDTLEYYLGETFNLQSFACLTLYNDGINLYHSVEYRPTADFRRCLQTIDLLPGIFLYREINLGQGDQAQADVCEDRLMAQNLFEVWFQEPYNLTNLGPEPIDCPFPNGTYYLSHSSSTTAANQCLGNQASTADVAGSKITTTSCVNSNSYGQPYNSELTCVAMWSGDLLDSQDGSTDGDFLLLSYFDESFSRTIHMCVRYKVLSNEVLFSVNLGSNFRVECMIDGNYSSYGGGNTAFVLSNDIPTTEAPSTESPTTVMTTTEVPTTEAPTTEVPSTEAPTTVIPTTEAPTTVVPTTEAPTTVVPTTEAPTTVVPTTEAPTTVVPTTEAPTTVVPTTDAPTTVVPTTDAPTTVVPTTDAPTTVVPTTDAPTTVVPTTEAPTTVVPTTEAPTTVVPTTEAPTTVVPTTEASTTVVPTTEAPTTVVPTTEAPTTEALTTVVPTTEAQTTLVPSTEEQTTVVPSTEAHTTVVPSTEAPTTVIPTTDAPTTVMPTTDAPTTVMATTDTPTTVVPTTEAPTTVVSTTEAPTTALQTSEATTTTAAESTVKTTTTAAPITTTPACKYPSAILNPRIFWAGQQPVGNDVLPLSVTFFMNMLIDYLGSDAIASYDCLEGFLVDTKFYSLVQLIGSPDSKQCHEVVQLGPNLLSFRYTYLQPGDSTTTAGDCPRAVQTESFGVLIDAGNNVELDRCPFPEGAFPTSVSTSGSDEDVCRGVAGSIVTVQGNMMILTLCDSTDEYGKPFQSSLKCLGDISADNLQPGQSQYGNFVVLSRETTTKTDYYCARYLATSGEIHLSLNLNSNGYFISCDPTKDARYYEENAGFVALVLSKGVDVDECQSSPCQNGGTCTDGNGFYFCSCPEDAFGTNCENEITESNNQTLVTVILIIVFAVILLALIIVGVGICQYRKNNKTKINDSTAPSSFITGMGDTAYETFSTAWYPDIGLMKNNQLTGRLPITYPDYDSGNGTGSYVITSVTSGR